MAVAVGGEGGSRVNERLFCKLSDSAPFPCRDLGLMWMVCVGV